MVCVCVCVKGGTCRLYVIAILPRCIVVYNSPVICEENTKAKVLEVCRYLLQSSVGVSGWHKPAATVHPHHSQHRFPCDVSGLSCNMEQLEERSMKGWGEGGQGKWRWGKGRGGGVEVGEVGGDSQQTHTKNKI